MFLWNKLYPTWSWFYWNKQNSVIIHYSQLFLFHSSDSTYSRAVSSEVFCPSYVSVKVTGIHLFPLSHDQLSLTCDGRTRQTHQFTSTKGTMDISYYSRDSHNTVLHFYCCNFSLWRVKISKLIVLLGCRAERCCFIRHPWTLMVSNCLLSSLLW